MKDKKTQSIISGISFAICAIVPIINAINSKNISIWTILSIAGFGVVSASCFISKPLLTVLGACLIEISGARALVTYIKVLGYDFIEGETKTYYTALVIAQLLFIATVFFVLLSGLVKDSKKYGFVAGSIAAVRFLIYIISNINVNGGKLSLLPYTVVMLFALVPASLFIGFVLDGVSWDINVKTASKVSSSVSEKSSGSQIERLTQLSKLFEDGVITQEEFEEKKKQIIESV